MPQVLIVEDTEDIAMLVAITLEQAGFETVHCNSAIKALEYLEAVQPKFPDLIVLDIGMPLMSGWEFLEIIKKEEALQNIKIVVTTAFGDPANRVVGKLQAVDAYVTKPFGPDALLNVVENVLNVQ